MSGADRLPVATGAEVRRAVGALLRPRRGAAAVAGLVLLAATLAGLVVPPALGRIVDVAVEGRPAGDVTLPVLVLALAALAQGGLTWLGGTLVARLGEGMLAGLRERVVSRALTLPAERLEQAGTGDLAARVGDDVTEVSAAAREGLPEMAGAGLTVGLTIVGLGVIDWRLALAGLLAAPVQAWTVRWYLRQAGPLYAAERAAGSARAQQVLDSVGGAATVRAFGLGEEHLGRVRDRSADAMTWSLRAVRIQTRFYGRLNLAELIGTSAILVVGFLLVRDGSATVGEATAAALYFLRLFDPINVLLGVIDEVQRAAASLARLVAVADLPEPEDPAGAPEPGAASVAALGVGHAYVAGRPVLHDVRLEVQPGERVALVGPSGAGKTTLARLLAGVGRPGEGRILIGGVDRELLGDRAVRRAVGLVSQEVHVFAGTLREDLRLAAPEADDARLEDALARVGALGWARALPEGLDTAVGDGAHALTPVQAQQLALARLLLADPPVAVLDEATAEAGSAGARTLERAVDAALEGRSALVVAHRLTQAARADRIVVLEAGRVVEEGRHEELVSAGGPYAALWRAWSEARPA